MTRSYLLIFPFVPLVLPHYKGIPIPIVPQFPTDVCRTQPAVLKDFNSRSNSKMKRWSGNFDVDDYLVRILPQPWLHHLPGYISRWFGYRSDTPTKRPDVIILLWTWIGAFCGVSVIEAVFQRNPYFSDRGVPIIVGSFVPPS
jgi:hypothetical protein